MAEQALDSSPYFKAGCYLDAVDSSQHWLVAFIKQVDPAKGILVRFDGWSNKWNEWLSVKSHRVTPFRRHTVLYTGQQSSALRDWVFSREEVQRHHSSLQAALNGDLSSFSTAYDVTQFFRGHLFMLVDNLLNQSFADESDLELVLTFLNSVMVFALQWVKTLPTRYAAIYQGLANPEAYLTDKEVAFAFIWQELFCTLERLFGCEQRLQEFLTAGVANNIRDKLKKNDALVGDLDDFPVRRHFLALFIENEGFETLIRLVQEKEDSIPIQLISDFPVWKPLLFLSGSPSLLANYQNLIDSVLGRLSRFSEKDQRHYDKSSIQNTLSHITEFARIHASLELFEHTEKAEMRIAMDLLKGKFLDKRVKGINNLTEGIARVAPGLDQFKWFSMQEMLNWLRTEKVVETMLTDRPHIEILKRSQAVFTFLAERGQLTFADLEALWTSMTDKHESYVRTVYDLLPSLATFLPKEMLDFLYGKMREIDLNQCPDFVILGMKQFTLNANVSLRRENRELEPFCLTEFLKMITARDSPQEQATLVCTYIAELLKYETMQPFRSAVFSQLLAITNSSARVQSAALLSRLLADLPSDCSTEFLQTHGASLLSDAISWVTSCVSIPNSEKDLNTLLDFLESVASKGAAASRIREEDMFRLWEAFTGTECPGTYSNLFFGWLHGSLSRKADFLIETDFALRVFDEFLCKLTGEMIARLQSGAFLCFQQFFLHCNFRYGYLRYREDYVVSRLGEDLLGIETLILFALNTKEENVLGKAIKLIGQLHLRITKECDQTIIKRFITTRLQTLTTLQKEPNPTTETDFLIERNLRIITGMVEGYEYVKTGRFAKVDFHDWQTVYYRIENENSWKTLSLSKSDSIGTLRRAIANVNRFSPDCVKMENGQQLYTFIDDDRILGRLGHALHFIVRHELHDYVLLDIMEIVGDDEDAQEMLFALISLSEKPYRELVWFLLSRLTSHKLVQTKVKELGFSFTSMTHGASFHKQLFCLLVLHLANRQSLDFKVKFNTYRPNELFRVLAANANTANSDLISYFEHYDSALVLQYAQLMLLLTNAFRVGNLALDVPKTDVVLYVLDLLYLYAKNVKEMSEMTQPSIPDCAWQTIMEYMDLGRNPELPTLVAKYRNLENLLFFSLQRAKNGFFSSKMKDFFLRASLYPINLQSVLTEKLITVLPEAVKSTETTNAYFSLTAKLIKQQREGDYEAYFQVLCQFLGTRNSEEHANAEDKGMTGALKLMRAMVTKCPSLPNQSIAEYLLLTCLIDFEETHESQSNKPKCKSAFSRLAAFKLLASFCEKENVRKYVLSVLSQFHRDTSWRKPKLLCWLNAYNTYEKSATGFVGLRNLGCTCYMNSMLQQLFMIPSFRDGLFQCESTGPKGENVLFQLQKILAGLKKSDKMFVQTRGLCTAYTNWEGQPINPHEQMDTDEFFNGLMDKTEESLKPTVRAKVVEEHFRGILTTQCLGKGSCTHRSERDEPFLTLPIEIKNKKSIFESLEALTTGETLEGDNAYACDYCSAKVTARRRLCIRSLPNVLILTLRRFEFDMDTMNRVKLNSYCEFPLTLDMEPFTLEAVMLKDAQDESRARGQDPDSLTSSDRIPADYFQYTLRGIIIHLGLAEAGHYYSYILDQTSGKWIEFNDSNVDYFDQEHIPTEAFGTMDKLAGEEANKIRNAYVLLYERQAKYLLKGKDDPVPVRLPESVSAPVSPSVQELLEHVHASNQKYWRKRRVFSPEYSHFILSLTAKSEDPEVMKFVLSHYFTAQIRSKEPALKLMRHIYEHAPARQEAAFWLLEMISFEPMLKELMIDCPMNEVKKFIVGLTDRCLRNVSPEQQERFLIKMLAVLPKMPGKSTTQHSGYFELLYRLAKINPEAFERVGVSGKLLAHIFDLLPQDIENAEIVSGTIQDFGLGRETEALISKFPSPPVTQATSYSYQIAALNQTLEHLQSNELELLKDPENISVLVKGAYGKFGANQMARLYKSLIRTDPDVFKKYAQALLQEVRNNDYDQHKSALIQLKRLISGNESAKMIFILKDIGQILVSNMMYIRATESIINFLYRLVGRFPAVRSWLSGNLQPLLGLNAWRQKYLMWNNQSTNGLYLTKVYNPHSQFIEYHPSSLVSNRIIALLGNKVPESEKDLDSDDDLYEETLSRGSNADFCFKDEVFYRVEVVESFGTSYYVKYDNVDQAQTFFLSADDDRLLRSGTKFKSLGIK